jgi:monoamine oxidase
MPQLSRRSFLAASAAVAARRALGATTPARHAVDVVIVGAGAAGIAAARRIAAAGRHYVLIEAADHIGGRCVTDTRTFGVPFDRGAHWIHMPDINPLTRLTPRGGIEVYPASESQKVRIGLRYAREGELEDYLAAQVRATRAIADAARKADVAGEQAVPSDLGDWRSTVEFVLGPYGCGKDLAQVSAADLARSTERDVDAFCRQGFGALLAALAEGTAVELSAPATAIEVWRGVNVTTPKGTITAHAAIVTVSTNVLAAGAIKFTPELPHRQVDAFNSLSLGSYDHIALEFLGNPLGLESDDLVFEKSVDTHTAAILANVAGTPLSLVEVAGSFGRDLSAQGEAAMVDFAGEWLARLYGGDVKKTIGRASATRWNSEPLTRGAFSAAAPGGQGARRVLTEAVHDSIWFAGEAAHETLAGTVGGAWESGNRAAEAVLGKLGVLKEQPAEVEAAPKRKQHRARVEPRRRSPYEVPNIMGEER